MNKTNFKKKLLGLSMFASVSLASMSAVADLGKAIDSALEFNPEFKASWTELLITNSDVKTAISNAHPAIDLIGDYGVSNKKQGGEKIPSQLGWSAELRISQVLYDASINSNIDKSKSVQKAKYYNLISSANDVAFSASRVYLDVARNKELVWAAEKNLEKHKEIFSKIEHNKKAGVSNAADLEHIRGRVAVSEGNLMAAEANLNAAIANYIRVIGSQPPAELEVYEFNNPILTSDLKSQIASAQSKSPVIKGAVEYINAERHNVSSLRASNRPEAEIYVSSSVRSASHDAYQLKEEQNIINNRIGVQVKYNLYKGGANKAAIQRSLDQVSLAQEQRNAACLAIQRDVAIASSELQTINSRLPLAHQHVASTQIVRTAYAEQFRVGKRSLLDVLDSENEYFQSHVNAINLKHDKAIKEAELLKSAGSLMNAISKKGIEAPELGQEIVEQDLSSSTCPSLDVWVQ